jgi:hypothetical protein
MFDAVKILQKMGSVCIRRNSRSVSRPEPARGWLDSHRDRPESWQQILAIVALIAWSLAMIWLCWSSGVQHDYHAYLRQWGLVLHGDDPWRDNNAYGPLHNVIGLLTPINPLAPKLFMVGALLLANATLMLALLRERGTSPIQAVYLLAVPTNVLVVGMGVIYGLNDAIVAALLVAAVLMRHWGNWFACGIFVGLAALTKFYPLLLLPFFAIDEGEVQWAVIKGGVIVFFVGVVAALAIWGDGLVRAMAFGSERGPKSLSIIRALSSVFSRQSISPLIEYNSVAVVLGVAVAFVFVLRTHLSWLEGVVIGYLAMLTIYKVGHQQFYIPWLFVVASLPLLGRRSADLMALIFIPAILLLSLYQFGYQFGSDWYHNELGWVRNYGGFIAFPVSVVSLAVYLFYRSRVVARP